MQIWNVSFGLEEGGTLVAHRMQTYSDQNINHN